MAELGIYLSMYVWKSQVNFLSVILQELSLQGWFFVFETDLSQTSHRVPGILPSPHSQNWDYICTTHVFMWILKTKHRSLCLHSKHLPKKAVSWVRNINLKSCWHLLLLCAHGSQKTIERVGSLLYYVMWVPGSNFDVSFYKVWHPTLRCITVNCDEIM